MFATETAGEMGRRTAALDWSRTSLGPMDDWPPSLTTTVGMVLHSRFPMFLFWGPDAICLYNDAYRPSLGAGLHPGALGMRGEELWSEIWHIIGPQIDAVMARGEQTWFEDQVVPFDRNGYFEEIYFTYSYSPVFAESGSVGGTLVVCSETTEQVVSKRRMQTLLNLSTTARPDVGATLEAIREVVAASPADLPFGALYRPVPDGAGHAELVWATGLAPGHPLAPGRLDLGPDARPWPSSGDLGAGGERIVVALDRRAGGPGGAWPEPCREAVVSAITGPGVLSGGYLLVTGLSPRKALDAPYHDFLDLLVAGMASSIGQAERERSVAVQLQQALLGRIDQVAGVHAATAYRPATAGLQVGGDWYDAIRLPDERIGLVIGDVVGHGLVAATVMGQLRSAVRALALSVDDPAELIGRLEVFGEQLPEARYTTLVYAILDPRTGRLDYSVAGHPPPFVLRLDGRGEFLDQGRGSPVGTRTQQPRATASTVLLPGNTLLLYTDGLIERRGEPVTTGVDRLGMVAQQFWLRTDEPGFAGDLVAAMLQDVDQPDDVAVLGICMAASTFRYRLPADARTLRDARSHLRVWLEGHSNATAEDVDRTLLAVGEVCANAVEHAYHGEGAGIVQIRVVAGPTSLAVQVCDKGRWRPRPAPGHRGRGLRLVRAVAERVDVLAEAGGTTVRLAIALGAKPHFV
jgi:anti-sigma regulatory factor (Ser/Thr protein kinase)